MKSDGVVIVGAGQAGFQVAASLRMEGYEGPVTLIGDEPNVPYQRPPLSKGFMAGKQAIEGIALRPFAFYESHRNQLVAGTKVTEIDRVDRSASLVSSHGVHRGIHYDALVLAVGARNRTLPIKGAELDGICYLRTDAEAVEIQQRLAYARDIVVIGGGFIGLELAAAARGLGKSVRVLEVQSRLMPRVVSPILSDFYRDVHTSQGVEISLNAGLSEIAGSEGKVSEVILGNGFGFRPIWCWLGLACSRISSWRATPGSAFRTASLSMSTCGPKMKACTPSATVPITESVCGRARADRVRAECGGPGQMHRGVHRGTLGTLSGRAAGFGRTNSISSCKWRDFRLAMGR